MIPVMTRLKIHHLAEGGVPQKAIAEKLGVGVRSVERILSEPAPTADDLRADRPAEPRKRGRPSKVAAIHDRVAETLLAQPNLPTVELLRLSRGWGYAGAATALYDLVKQLRPPPPREAVVRFEGLPGEYAQFDFGESKVRFADGRVEKITFFAGRLKYSRYVHVVVTTDQQAESLIRALVACLEAFGGAPKEWVFDNPKTVRVSPIGEPIRFHPYLRDLAADMNVLPTLCTPRMANQKGSVENLVGFVKKNFLLVRAFRDRADLLAQLAEWLQDVNHRRRCDATGEIPEARRAQEMPWLQQRPVRASASEHALRESRIITPMATVSYAGATYSAPPKRIGATATLLIRADRIDLVVDQERCSHVRKDGARAVQRLPEHRREVLAIVHGERKRSFFKRECLLELGPPAHDFLEQLVHRTRWQPEVESLYALLQDHSNEAMCRAFAACHAAGRYSAGAVAAELRRAA